MHLMSLTGFFENTFRRTGDENNFSSLGKLTETMGSTTYGIVYRLAIVAILISLVISGAYLALSSRGKSRDEAKQRLMRVVVIAFLVTSLAGLIGLVISLFVNI